MKKLIIMYRPFMIQTRLKTQLSRPVAILAQIPAQYLFIYGLGSTNWQARSFIFPPKKKRKIAFYYLHSKLFPPLFLFKEKEIRKPKLGVSNLRVREFSEALGKSISSDGPKRNLEEAQEASPKPYLHTQQQISDPRTRRRRRRGCRCR